MKLFVLTCSLALLTSWIYNSNPYIQHKESPRQQKCDSIYERHELKNNCILFFCRSNDRNQVVLEDSNTTKILYEEYVDLGRSALGHLYADFDSIFVLYRQFGSNPIMIELYEKQTGELLINGEAPFHTDTLNEIIMFEKYESEKKRLILYDCRNRKASSYDAPQGNQCLIGSCWELLQISENELTIRYLNTKKQDSIVTFKR